DFYGILRPHEQSGLTIKAVNRDTALLFLTLQSSGPLPAYVRENQGAECNEAMASLVLDGVLQIEQGGAFVSGPEAHLTATATPAAETGRGTIGRLSIAALHYGQALGLRDPGRLSGRLYCYNRLPASPFWQSRFPTPRAVARHLG